MTGCASLTHASLAVGGACVRAGRRQGAGVEGLLSALDAVRAEHEGMAAEEFNDDGTYKTGINQVMGVRGGGS